MIVNEDIIDIIKTRLKGVNYDQYNVCDKKAIEKYESVLSELDDEMREKIVKGVECLCLNAAICGYEIGFGDGKKMPKIIDELKKI